MIEIKNIAKKYDDSFVLDGVNSKIKDGSIYGLIGSNGAGKSTLLNIIDGILKAEKGQILVNGNDVYESTEIKDKIAYISDDPFYFNAYTMDEMADYLNTAYPSFSMEKYKAIAKNFPLETNRKINTFSKGMKRQSAIILALARNPEILLCDECFDGLDPVIKQLVKRLLINEVSERKMTVVISSHDLRELENLCDVIGILHNNKIIIEKSIEDIKTRMHKFQLAFKPMIEISEIKGLDIVKAEIRGNIIEMVVRGDVGEATEILQNLNPILIDTLELNLEDVFIYEMEATGYDFSKILL